MKKFRLTIEVDCELTAAEIWPDGDAPDEPTEADVLAAIRDCGGDERVMRDWNLLSGVEIDVREVKP